VKKGRKKIENLFIFKKEKQALKKIFLLLEKLLKGN
jgi:hypothetical protein